MLVGQATTAGLDNQVVEVLDRERLVAYQQRNDDQWVELTHDSMIRAIHHSNGRWHEGRRRRRRRRRNVLALLIALVAGLFFVLRQPAAETRLLADGSGILTTSPERVQFTAPADQVTLVSGRVYSYGREPGDEPPTLHVVPAGGEAATVVQTSDTRVDEDGSGTDVYYLQVSFRAPAVGRYDAVLEPGEATGSKFELTVTAVPLAITAGEAAKEHVEAPKGDTFALEAPPGPPLIVTIEDGYISDESGADVLNDDTTAVVPADDQTRYVVLSVYRYGRLKVHVSPMDGDVGRLIVDQPQPLRTREFAASLSFENPSREPLVIGAVCASGGVGIVVYDDAHRVVAATTGASLPVGPQSEEFVVVTLPEGTYHAQFIRGGNGEELSCTVGAVGLADRTLTGPVEQALPFAAKAGFDAFLIESTSGSIALVDGVPGVDQSLRCGDHGRSWFPVEDRLAALVQPGEACAVVLVHTDESAAGEARVRLIPLTSATERQP